MKAFADRIDDLHTEIADLEKAKGFQQRLRAQALADLEMNRKGSHEFALATAELNSAVQSIADLVEAIERKSLALGALKERQRLLVDPEMKAETDRTMKEAQKLRQKLDKQCAEFGKSFGVAVQALRELSQTQDALLEICPDYDASGAGHLSVANWLTDELALYTKAPSAYLIRSGKPERPGTGFRPFKMIERSIRKRAEQKAEATARRMALAPPETE